MIWTLAREQLRSQKRFVVWTAALLTIAIALATYAAITTTTQISNDLRAQQIMGNDNEFQGAVASTIGETSDQFNSGADVAPIEEVDAQIANAIESGSDIQARRDTELFLTGPTLGDGSFDNSFETHLTSVTGNYEWQTMLVAGTAPGPGGVALSGRLAGVLGVELGDTVPLFKNRYNSDGVPFAQTQVDELTVSGITRGPALGRNYSVDIPEAYAAWDDSVRLITAGTPDDSAASKPGLNRLTYLETVVSWNEASTPLTAFSLFDRYFGSPGGRSDSSGVSVTIAVALFIGLIAMSFAVGRSQAQARARWAATARVMGARRSTIAAATVLETLVLGCVASAIGIVLGWLSVLADLALIRNSVPDAFLPGAPVVLWWVLGIVLLLGLVIAAIVGVIPAFWSSRVSPVAALKPVIPVMEEEVSRRVSITWLVVAWCLATITLLVAISTSDPGTPLAIAAVLSVIAVLVLGFALLTELLRRVMPVIGRRLARSARPWAISAGEAMTARPRQAAIPALIMAIVMIPLMGIFTTMFRDDWLLVEAGIREMGVDAAFGWEPGMTPTTVLPYALVFCAIAVFLAVAIFASGSHTMAADQATQAALGMTIADVGKARAALFSLPLVAGTLIGSAVGLLGSFTLAFVAPPQEGFTHGWPLLALGSTSLPNLLCLATAAALIAIGTAIVTATTSRRTPIGDLARASA